MWFTEFIHNMRHICINENLVASPVEEDAIVTVQLWKTKKVRYTQSQEKFSVQHQSIYKHRISQQVQSENCVKKCSTEQAKPINQSIWGVVYPHNSFQA